MCSSGWPAAAQGNWMKETEWFNSVHTQPDHQIGHMFGRPQRLLIASQLFMCNSSHYANGGGDWSGWRSEKIKGSAAVDKVALLYCTIQINPGLWTNKFRGIRLGMLKNDWINWHSFCWSTFYKKAIYNWTGLVSVICHCKRPHYNMIISFSSVTSNRTEIKISSVECQMVRNKKLKIFLQMQICPFDQ